MRFVELPDELLQQVDAHARTRGGPLEDKWFQLSLYEHRVRPNRLVMQLIVNQLHLEELAYKRLVYQLERLPGASTYARTEKDGTRTVQVIGLGQHVLNGLMRSPHRTVYSIVDDLFSAFVVEELPHAQLAQSLGGDMLTLIASSSAHKLGSCGSPTIRVFDARVSGRHQLATKGLRMCCHALQRALKM